MCRNFWIDKYRKRNANPNKLFQSSDFAEIPKDICVYAIGDIHGMADVLRQLLNKITEDRLKHRLKSSLIFLGDYIDRGLQSKLVLESLIDAESSQNEELNCIFLKGNHEQMLLDFIEDPVKNGVFWLRNGGDVTLASYGVQVPRRPSAKQLNALRDQFSIRLPPRHLKFIKELKSKFAVGDYFFCHAGVKIGQPLDDQSDEILLWTRELPNETTGPQEKIIVHGHQPVATPVMAPYHINVDTGAYVTGCLTALKLLDKERKFISTEKQKFLKVTHKC